MSARALLLLAAFAAASLGWPRSPRAELLELDQSISGLE